MADWYSMSEDEKQDIVNTFGLLLMLTIAVILACIAIGMMFGVAWGFVAAAAFAAFEFFATRHNIKKKQKKANDDE